MEVMQPAININEDLYVKELWNVHMSLHKATGCESSSAPEIRNDRVQGSPILETNGELHPHFQLHSSAKQTKGCVLETQPVSGFSSAVGLCYTASFLSDILNSISRACPGKSKSFPRFHRENVSPLALPWDECSHGLHAKATKERSWLLSWNGLNAQLKQFSTRTQTER